MGIFPDTGPGPGPLGWAQAPEEPMPIYVDYHPSAELSVTDIKTFLQAAQRGAADEHGVYPVELFCGDEGPVFCVHVASNEAAVLRRHRRLGLPCREVHQV